MNPIDLRELPGAFEVYLCHDEGYFPSSSIRKGKRSSLSCGVVRGMWVSPEG